jgi:hypothetical protein
MIVLTPVEENPRNQKIASRPLIVITVDRHGKVKEIFHVEKRLYVIYAVTR